MAVAAVSGQTTTTTTRANNDLLPNSGTPSPGSNPHPLNPSYSTPCS